MRFRRFLLAVAAVTAFACRAKPDGPTVPVYVDGDMVRAVPVGETASALTSSLSGRGADAANWRHLEAKARDGRFVDARRPSESYGPIEARLYLERGAPTLGLFRPMKPDLPPAVAAIARRPVLSLPDVTEIRIRTREPEEFPDAGEKALAIEVVGDDEVAEFAPSRLAGLPERSGEGGKQKGWALAEVAALRVPGGRIRRIHVENAEGATSFDRPALDDPKQLLLLKRNKRGEYVFRQWVEGAEKPQSEMRDVRAIRIETGEGGGDSGVAGDVDDGP